ncbi:MAG: hypothetical protein ACJAYG_002140 [Oceanicoccus sp.]|jgi:uncharacterized protein YjaG (DUF416 family)
MKALEDLTEWQAISLGACLVARMRPNYILFAEIADSSDAAVFTNILNLVWEFAAGQNQKIDFQKQLEKLEVITPDLDAYDFYGVWPALDATVALASLLSCCERFDTEEIAAIATLSRSTIDGYLSTAGIEFDEPEHPLVIDEQAFVEQLLSVLRQQASRVVMIAELKALVATVAVSNIGLEAV